MLRGLRRQHKLWLCYCHCVRLLLRVWLMLVRWLTYLIVLASVWTAVSLLGIRALGQPAQTSGLSPCRDVFGYSRTRQGPTHPTPPVSANDLVFAANRSYPAIFSLRQENDMTYALKGSICGEGGQPLPGLSLTVARFEGDFAVAEVPSQESFDTGFLRLAASRTVVTSKTGSIVLAGLGPGNYVIQPRWDELSPDLDYLLLDLRVLYGFAARVAHIEDEHLLTASP